MPIFLPEPLRLLLSPLAALYGGLVEIRNHYFDRGYLPVQKLPVPVVSVGNLTMGGSGKTPVAAYLARRLESRGLNVAVLTQGYGRRCHDLVSLDRQNLSQIPAAETGDEPRILAARLQQGRVWIYRNRVLAARRAMRQTPRPDVFLLDDGFQFRFLARDLNILTVDAATLNEPQQVIPAGWLREPLHQGYRADLVWFTRANQAQIGRKDIDRWFTRAGFVRPFVLSAHQPVALVVAGERRKLPLEVLRGERVLAFCGIANPESFRMTLMDLGAQLVGFQAFPDHRIISPGRWRKLEQQSRKQRARWLVTTEKDAVRQPVPDFLQGRLLYVQVEVVVLEGEEVLEGKLAAIGTHPGASGDRKGKGRPGPLDTPR